jgi:hypothetical protein
MIHAGFHHLNFMLGYGLVVGTQIKVLTCINWKVMKKKRKLLCAAAEINIRPGQFSVELGPSAQPGVYPCSV